MKHSHYYKIAVDGPAGSGKSTIAKLLARTLGLLYIDSGAMYRCVALYLLRNNLLKASGRRLKSQIKKVKINFKAGKKVFLNNVDVTHEIRTGKVNEIVSEVSGKKIIRAEMVKRQRDFGLNSSVVMDGRDIGTVVFKDAALKIYLTASVEERAKRRGKDLLRLGEEVPQNQLIKEIYNRDNYDSSRKISPLSKAHDAIVIDSSNFSVKEVLDKISVFLPN